MTDMGETNCEECDAVVRWDTTVRVQGVRWVAPDAIGMRSIRVCRNCAGRAILAPTVDALMSGVSAPANWKWLWRNSDQKAKLPEN